MCTFFKFYSTFWIPMCDISPISCLCDAFCLACNCENRSSKARANHKNYNTLFCGPFYYLMYLKIIF